MMISTLRICPFLMILAAAIILLTPDTAAAYGGPGSVISGIGAFLAVLVAMVASIFGFIWYPLKKLVRRLRGSDTVSESATAPDQSEQLTQ